MRIQAEVMVNEQTGGGGMGEKRTRGEVRSGEGCERGATTTIRKTRPVIHGGAVRWGFDLKTSNALREVTPGREAQKEEGRGGTPNFNPGINWLPEAFISVKKGRLGGGGLPVPQNEQKSGEQGNSIRQREKIKNRNKEKPQ